MKKDERLKAEFQQLYEVAKSAANQKEESKLFASAEAKRQGFDERQAGLFGFLEAFTLVSMARTGNAARRDLLVMQTAMQQDFDERTSALALGIAQLKQSMQTRGGSVAGAAWNWAAGTMIGQQLGIKPLELPSYYPAPEPVPPPPPTLNPHRLAATPPIVSNLNASILGGGGYVEVVNASGYTSTDTQFRLHLEPNGGNLPPVNHVLHVDFGTAYDRLPTILMQANCKADPQLYIENQTVTGFDLFNRGSVIAGQTLFIDFLVLPTSGDTHF